MAPRDIVRVVKNEDTGTTTIFNNLQELRSALLALHKALVDSERVQYEKTFGKIQSPNQFLQLLTTDPWFAWLSPLSKLIVSVDEALDAREPVSRQGWEGFLKQADALLRTEESGAGFRHHYFEALQRDPDVVMTHAQVTRVAGWPRRRG